MQEIEEIDGPEGESDNNSDEFLPNPNNPDQYVTVVKDKSDSGSDHGRSKDEDEDGRDSELTKVLIHSAKADDYDEERKETEENEIFREAKKHLFLDGNDEIHYNKILSPHNPFEAMDDTIDAKEKVVHLSTINTDENLEQHNDDQPLETEP